MPFDVLNDPERIRHAKERLRKKVNPFQVEGEPIYCKMPAATDLFYDLRIKLIGSDYSKLFKNRHYLLKSRQGLIEEVMPAGFYIRDALDSIREKLTNIHINTKGMNEQFIKISEKYEMLERSGMPLAETPLELSEEIHNIHTHTTSFLFNMRSIFDVLSKILGYIYGPDCRIFNKFTDFMKHLRNNPEFDTPMAEYIKENFQWFYDLRDFRDYITHTGSIDARIKRSPSGSIAISSKNNIDLSKLLNSCMDGLNNYIDFFNKHHIARLTAK